MSRSPAQRRSASCPSSIAASVPTSLSGSSAGGSHRFARRVTPKGRAGYGHLESCSGAKRDGGRRHARSVGNPHEGTSHVEASSLAHPSACPCSACGSMQHGTGKPHHGHRQRCHRGSGAGGCSQWSARAAVESARPSHPALPVELCHELCHHRVRARHWPGREPGPWAGRPADSGPVPRSASPVPASSGNSGRPRCRRYNRSCSTPMEVKASMASSITRWLLVTCCTPSLMGRVPSRLIRRPWRLRDGSGSLAGPGSSPRHAAAPRRRAPPISWRGRVSIGRSV